MAPRHLGRFLEQRGDPPLVDPNRLGELVADTLLVPLLEEAVFGAVRGALGGEGRGR